MSDDVWTRIPEGTDLSTEWVVEDLGTVRPPADVNRDGHDSSLEAAREVAEAYVTHRRLLGVWASLPDDLESWPEPYRGEFWATVERLDEEHARERDAAIATAERRIAEDLARRMEA